MPKRDTCATGPPAGGARSAAARTLPRASPGGWGCRGWHQGRNGAQEAISGPNFKRPITKREIRVSQKAISGPNPNRPSAIPNPPRLSKECDNAPIQQR